MLKMAGGAATAPPMPVEAMPTTMPITPRGYFMVSSCVTARLISPRRAASTVSGSDSHRPRHYSGYPHKPAIKRAAGHTGAQKSRYWDRKQNGDFLQDDPRKCSLSSD